MKESIIYSTSSLYRDDFRVKAYTFGQGEKTLCIVGNMRGNEYQQIYICSQLMRFLKQWELEDRFLTGKQVMIIPSVNPSSMNIGKRFWAIDNTDINRMFPGYSEGETTQRIAAGVFEVINKYQNAIQLTSFYMPGDFSPHVRMMRTGYENVKKAEDFGFPYIVVRNPRPYDTTTLNYNLQIWETDAYSLYSNTTSRIDPDSALKLIEGIERFMILNGILKGETSPADAARVFEYGELISLRTTQAGLYHRLAEADSHVKKDTPCAEIYDPCSGDILETLYAPADGVIFFQQNDPLVYAYTAAVKLLADPA
ncbi:MAG: M14 family metallopeptidase [Lachnospiraceae bacterium]|nr:M14 family metallopeptidase [Lachnospiraceae bacterium]